MALDFSFSLDDLKGKAPPLIGVDISSSAVKMVELSESKGQYQLERYAVEPLPKDVVVDGNISDPDRVRDVVNRTWKKMETRIKNVAIALPSAQVINKLVMLPGGLSEREMELHVETEANQYVPFQLDECNIDFQVKGPSAAVPEDVDVVIAAARKDKVDERVASVESSGVLKAVVLDSESYATQGAYQLLRNQLPQKGEGLTVALMDVGATMWHLNVFRGEDLIFTRESSFGGNQLTQSIQHRFSMDFDEAELAKRHGGLPDSYESEVLQPFLETMAVEVERALQFFFTSSQLDAVDVVLLAGGCAVLPGAVDLVNRRLAQERGMARKTAVANPFAGINVASRIKPRQLTQDAPMLIIACGLALRRFDPS